MSDSNLNTLIGEGRGGAVLVAGVDRQPAARASRINALERLALAHAPGLPLVFARDRIHSHRPTGRPLPATSPRQRDIVPVDAPLFPFGFGLTFARFACGPTRLDATTYGASQALRATVGVTNGGDRIASDVVQLYIRGLVAPHSRPVREFKAWRRVELATGESREVAFELAITS